MFDALFGWRKASKCKKLIKKLQCRLKLLKNKRRCIVKQLRDDVAELLKHGHDQTAFERVEQLVVDESVVQVYDLLEQFCEFILLNLPYIRKHRDCPNDINDAASTLIFSSARFGELPELLPIRKLFGERYGQRFVMAALELLPGNLVNHQIKDSLYMKKATDDVKYRLLDEIARTCIQGGPLLLEYNPQQQISCSEVDQTHNDNESPEIQLFIEGETEGKVICVGFSSESKNISKEGFLGQRDNDILPNEIKVLDNGGEKMIISTEYSEMDTFTVLGTRTSGMAVESSSETSSKLPEEIVYLDDIEEFVSPVSKDGTLQDQRLFMFRSFGVPLNEIPNYGIAISFNEQNPPQENLVSRSSRKTRKAISKRSRRRSVSQENTDIECATYYGESDESSLDDDDDDDNYYKRESNYNHRRFRKKSSAQENRILYGAKGTEMKSKYYKKLDLSCRCNSNGDIAKKCSLKNPCYLSIKGENEASENTSMRSIKEKKIDNGLKLCQYSAGDIEAHPMRAMTMPAERVKESLTDNVFRSNSFPVEQIHSSCRHIHPKLPDYDELAAKFMALKREVLQNKQETSNVQN